MGSLLRNSWVAPFMRKHRAVLAFAVVLSVLSSVFASALMFTSGYMISLAATIPFTVLALHLPSLFVRIFGVGKPILQYVERLASHDWVLRMTSSLRLRLYKTAEVVSADSSIGKMLGLFADDLEQLQNLFLRTIFPMLSIAAMYLIVFVAFGVLSPLMGLLMLVCIGLAVFAMPFWSLAVNGARVESRKQLVANMYDSLSDDVLGIVDWTLAGRRDELMERLESDYELAYDETKRVNAFERGLSIARQCIYGAAIVGVLAWASFAFFGEAGAAVNGFLVTGAAEGIADVVMHDSLPYAANWIAAFVLLMFPLLDAFSPASEAVLGIAEHRGALDELNDLDARAAKVDADGTQRKLEECLNAQDAIEIENVTFSYGASSDPVLAGANLVVPKGEHLAIIGRSGAGKSTLLALISGEIQPTAGTVRRSGKVGMIGQFPYVFRKSLRENLLLAKPDATDRQIEEVLRKVGLGELLDRLPQGLDTLMAEGGATLSGGERHRLALARILLFDCDIVLLDEPYLGLDDETRKAVSDTLLDALGERTILMVTHDTTHARDFDRIVKVEDGRIRESKLGDWVIRPTR